MLQVLRNLKAGRLIYKAAHVDHLMSESNFE